MTPTRTPIPTGLLIPSQVPLDNKLYFLNEATLINLGVSDNLAYSYYKGMLVYCAEEETNYIWKEIQIGEIGLLPNNFIYPNPWVKEGIIYSNKPYNFIKGIRDYDIENIGTGVGIYKDNVVVNNQTIFKLRKLNFTTLGGGALLLKAYIQNTDDITLQARSLLIQNVSTGGQFLKEFVTNSNDVTLVAKSLKTNNSGLGFSILKPISNNDDDVVITGRTLTGSNNVTITATADQINISVPIPDGTETKLIAGLNTTVDGNGSSSTPFKVNVTFPSSVSSMIKVLSFNTDQSHTITEPLLTGKTILSITPTLICKLANNSYLIGDITTPSSPKKQDSGGLDEDGIGVQFSNSSPTIIHINVLTEVTATAGFVANGNPIDPIDIDPAEWDIRLVILFV